MKRGPAERLRGQIIPDSLLPGFGLITHTTHITHPFRRTYHAYHAYHAPFPSATFTAWRQKPRIILSVA